MLSEYADTSQRVPALGFEQGHGGRSYGLDEVRNMDESVTSRSSENLNSTWRIRSSRSKIHPSQLDVSRFVRTLSCASRNWLSLELRRDGARGVRICIAQYALTSPLLALACSSNILVLVLSGSVQPPSPPRLVRIDLLVPENERTVDLYSLSASGRDSSNATNSASSSTRTSGVGQLGRQDPTSIHKLFVDPSGRHVIVSTLAGETFYFFSGWDTTIKKARPLPKLRGVVINAVSWNSPLAQSSSQVAQSTTSTKEILLGDTNGNIYECVIDASVGGEEGSVAATALRPFGRGGALERYFKHIYSLSSSQSSFREADAAANAITGIKAEIWAATSASQNSQRKRAVVIVTTSSRIQQFVGTVPTAAGTVSMSERDEGGMYEDLFKVYRDTTPSKQHEIGNGNQTDVPPESLDLPGEIAATELHLWQANKETALEPPKSLAWMTGEHIDILLRLRLDS